MRRLLFLTLLLAAILPMTAQRTITPVNPQITTAPVKGEKKQKTEEPKGPPPSVVERVDDSGRTFLMDTISGSEWIDSLAMVQPKVVGNIYPLINGVGAGIDVWPAVSRAFSSHNGIIGIWGQMDLHNRYFPTLEVGVGSASYSPSDMNFTYKSPVAPYFKVGMDYNFLYNSNPAYRVYAMVRYGLSPFKYDITDVTVTSGYWGETTHPEIPRQSTVNGWLEVGVGLQVKLWGPISAGWNFKYHRILHHSRETYGHPWAIPGYGTRSSSIGVSVSVIYTLPLATPIPEETPSEQQK